MTMNMTFSIKIKIISMSKQNILKMLVIFNIKYMYVTNFRRKLSLWLYYIGFSHETDVVL